MLPNHDVHVKLLDGWPKIAVNGRRQVVNLLVFMHVLTLVILFVCHNPVPFHDQVRQRLQVFTV